MKRSTICLFSRVRSVGTSQTLLCAVGLIVITAHTAQAGINVWTSHGPEGRAVFALAVDPTTPGILYAGASLSGVSKSTDGGGSWQAINAGLPDVYAFAIDPTTPRTLYAGTFGGGVFKSTDGGGTWQAINAGLGGTEVAALAIDPTTPRTLYAGTFGGGVFKSTDGGSSWQAINAGLSGSAVIALAIDPTTPRTLYAGTADGGALKSTDGGGSWQPVNAGLSGTRVQTLAIDPTSPRTLYAGTYGGAFKSTNGGGTWQAINAGLSNTSVQALAIDPTTPRTLYAGTYDNGDPNRTEGVFKSMDGGERWQAMNAGLSHIPVWALAIDPATPSTLYAGTSGGVFSIQQVSVCVGDCDANGSVTVDGIITLVNIALGNAPPSACAHGMVNGTEVTVAVIIQAVNNALSGCGLVCGNGITEPGEDCDDGGTCIGGPNAGSACTAEAQCLGTGVCMGGTHVGVACEPAVPNACPGSTCKKCAPSGGDGCAANCTWERDVAFDLVPGQLNGSGILAGTSGAVVQGDLLTIPLPFSGRETLTIGKARDGQIPVVIKAGSVRLDRVPVSTVGCVCLRGVAAKTCGGTVFEADGVTSSTDCTAGFTGGDRVCAGKKPCAFLHGSGNSASGMIGCNGLAGVNVSLTMDAGGSSGSPRLPRVTLSGTGGPGSALLSARIAIGGRAWYGPPCTGENVSVYGPDGAFCTDDDPQDQRGTPVAALVTTGTATGQLLNANSLDGNTIGPFSVSGAPFRCGGLDASGAALASMFTELARPNVGDSLYTSVLLPSGHAGSCVGDCDALGTVTVNELLTLVNVALGLGQTAGCPHGVPLDREVDIALILQAVTNTLSGCRGG